MQTFDCRDEFQGGYTQQRSSTDYIVVHHAASHYKQKTGIEDVRAIAGWHIRGRGWPGIAYHRVLAEEVNGGPVAQYVCSRNETLRYHVAGRNYECIGVCCATDFGSSLPDRKWVDALVVVLADLKTIYPNAQIVGHKDIALRGYETACPGALWLTWKPGLLARLVMSGADFQRYRVKVASARVRNKPTTRADQVGSLTKGKIVRGQLVEGLILDDGGKPNAQWLKMAEGRYVWSGLIEVAK